MHDQNYTSKMRLFGFVLENRKVMYNINEMPVKPLL